MKKIRAALIGNPNCGKTSLFNQLTGSHQHVGNWAGVTVDIKTGTCSHQGKEIEFIDLPGTYSLNSASPDERIVNDLLIDSQPDVVVNVCDATNLERNLYLTVQLLEMGIRPILVLNMWDEVVRSKNIIDLALLKQLLGTAIVTTNGRTGEGLGRLMDEVITHAQTQSGNSSILHVPVYPDEVENALSELMRHPALKKAVPSKRWIALALLEGTADDPGAKVGAEYKADCEQKIADHHKRITDLLGRDAETIIVETRYGFITGALREVLTSHRRNVSSLSDRIDLLLINRVLAYPIFLLFMWLLFQATFVLGAYPMDWIEQGFSILCNAVTNWLPDNDLRHLLVDGLIGGVGGVTVFLPNIMILFLGISIMEDTGYMARAAFINDRVMHAVGLHGKSFIPLLMGMGCNVPAILATRTLESKNDRIKTILLAPLVSCSARLPVYILFAGAFFGKNAGTVIFLFQFVFGIFFFFVMGFLFKLTLFRGEEHPFVMELPPYRLPTAQGLFMHMWYKTRHYLWRIGTVIATFSVVLWALSTFPRSPHLEAQYSNQIAIINAAHDLTKQQRDIELTDLHIAHESEVMKNTVLGRVGNVLEPATILFGADWRGAVSLLTGFVAKEIVVGSMGVLYRTRSGDQASLRTKIAGAFTTAGAVAFMFFVLLYTPCIAALATIVSELKNWRWSVFSVGYQLILAFAVSMFVFQIGTLLGW